MVLFLISIHIFTKQGFGSFAENKCCCKQYKFAYKTEIWAMHAYQFTEKRPILKEILIFKCEGAWNAVILFVLKMFT